MNIHLPGSIFHLKTEQEYANDEHGIGEVDENIPDRSSKYEFKAQIFNAEFEGFHDSKSNKREGKLDKPE
jgi:hypothetical protein